MNIFFMIAEKGKLSCILFIISSILVHFLAILINNYNNYYLLFFVCFFLISKIVLNLFLFPLSIIKNAFCFFE